jgi:hypothetical protein
MKIDQFSPDGKASAGTMKLSHSVCTFSVLVCVLLGAAVPNEARAESGHCCHLPPTSGVSAGPSLLNVNDGTSFVSFSEEKGKKAKGPQEGDDWLKWWEDRHSPTQMRAAWIFMYSPSSTDIDAAAQAYRDGSGGKNTEEKVQLLMKCVRDRFRDDSGKVCRHHAMLFYKVCDKLDIYVQYRCYAWGTSDSEGHSWNRVKIDDRLFVIDSFNGLWYEVK